MYCYGCCGIYDDTKKKKTSKVSVYKFPTKDDEKRAWVNALPNMLKVEDVTENIVICEKHWREGFETTTKKGHTRPKYPPNVFSVPASCAPQTSNAPRDKDSKGRFRITFRSTKDKRTRMGQD